MSELVTIDDPLCGSVARIAVARGFNCCSFEVPVGAHRVEVLDADPDFADGAGRPSGHGIPILFPFPNRIRGGRFEESGRDYQIPAGVCPDDGNGNAIHGFCLDRPWRVLRQDQSSVTAEFQLSLDAPDRLAYWPCDARITVCYSVLGTVLRAEILIENPSPESGGSLPWGFGTHPYFRLPLGAASSPGDCLVQTPAAAQWELVDCLPTGRVVPLDESCDLRDGKHLDQLQLDHVLTELVPTEPGRLSMRVLDAEAGLTVTQTCDAGLFRELVVFTPPGRDAVCLEPYTCVTDAPNLQAGRTENLTDERSGWRWLPRGDQIQATIEIAVGSRPD